MRELFSTQLHGLIDELPDGHDVTDCGSPEDQPLSTYASTRSRYSIIRSAALPSHFGGIVPFFHCPAINRASAGGSLLESVPINSLVPMVMVSGVRCCRARSRTMQEAYSRTTCATLRFPHYSNGKTRALARWMSMEINAPSSSSRWN